MYDKYFLFYYCNKSGLQNGCFVKNGTISHKYADMKSMIFLYPFFPLPITVNYVNRTGPSDG